MKLPNRMLFFRLSSMGDILLTTPLLRVFKKNYPTAQVHYITRQKYAEILQFNPYIDKLWMVNKSPEEIKSELPQSFDYFIDLHKNCRSRTFALRYLSATYRTYPKLNFRKILLTTCKINLLPQVHIVERYFHALRDFQLTYDYQGLDFFFPEKFKMELSFAPNQYIACVLGGTYQTKKYPVHKWTELIRLLHMPAVLLGGPDEKQEGDDIVQQTQNTINFCGKLNITESAYYLKHAAVVITHDTGLMHIAAALRKPIVSIWGNTVPAFGMYPLLPAGYEKFSMPIENTNISCRPCSKLGYNHCPKKHFKCMEDIPPQKIAQAALILLSQNA